MSVIQHNADAQHEFLCAIWQLCPRGFWLEAGGNCLIFDGAFRPIARVFGDEKIEIVGLDEVPDHGSNRKAVYLHHDFGLPLAKPARDLAAAFINKYGLADELRRRRELLRRGELACPADKHMRRYVNPKPRLARAA